MSIFEELVEELKEENLLEETVMSKNRADELEESAFNVEDESGVASDETHFVDDDIAESEKENAHSHSDSGEEDGSDDQTHESEDTLPESNDTESDVVVAREVADEREEFAKAFENSNEESDSIAQNVQTGWDLSATDEISNSFVSLGSKKQDLKDNEVVVSLVEKVEESRSTIDDSKSEESPKIENENSQDDLILTEVQPEKDDDTVAMSDKDGEGPGLESEKGESDESANTENEVTPEDSVTEEEIVEEVEEESTAKEEEEDDDNDGETAAKTIERKSSESTESSGESDEAPDEDSEESQVDDSKSEDIEKKEDQKADKEDTDKEETVEKTLDETEPDQDDAKDDTAEAVSELSEKDLYRKRIVDEVSGLQAVEHVISGIEREQMRKPPSSHDVVPIKQSLQSFIQEFSTLAGIEQTETETNLRKQIERWHSALLERDENVSTTNLRLYCENNKLNTKSLFSLTRFYRNSDFSESVRSKFDLVVTRLFSKEISGNKRQMVIEREDLIKSLNEMYAEWSSIPVYSVDDDDSELVLAAFKFEDFINEAKKTRNFDSLITSGFFKRIKAFKKKTSENFFAPLLIASAVECNVEIGNRYVSLIAKEKKKTDSKKLGDKYGGTHDSFVSEAASKTLKLVELLKDRGLDSKSKTKTKTSTVSTELSQSNSIALSGYKLLVFGGVLLAGLIASGYFVYSSFYSGTRELTATEKKVKLERSFLHEYVKSAKIKDNTFSANVTPAWNELSKGKKQEIVGKIYYVGKAKGYSKVELKDDSGKIVAVTLGTKVEIAE